MTEDPLLISRAIVVWIGKGTSSYPSRDKNRLVAEFGIELATQLLPLLQRLADEFYTTDASRTVTDLSRMGDVAAEQFRTRHPELTDEAVEVLRWNYTFDYK